MKKNTLLYLDEDLVREAKKNKVNISKIAEKSIKSTLFPHLSQGEKIASDFGKYLKDLEEEGNVYFLPFKIKSLVAEEIGPIKKLDIRFNDKNIIWGSNGSGKTILLRAIAHIFGKRELWREWETENSKLKLELSNESKSIQTNFKDDYKCILIDAGGERLMDRYFKKFIKYLSKLDCQVILTSSISRRDIENKFKVIRLNEEGHVTSPCDNCGKELLGITADKEITLFYKDANKDYDFCSKECLIKFTGKLK